MDDAEKEARNKVKKSGDVAGLKTGPNDSPGVERHNQYLWARRMGHENEPRWGLFKQVRVRGFLFVLLRVCMLDIETSQPIKNAGSCPPSRV